MRTKVALVLVALLAAPGMALADWIFADGFEVGDDRYWTGPLEACALPGGEPAPLCTDSLDMDSWLAYLPMWPDVRTWKACAIEPGTGENCLMLGAMIP